MKRKTIVEVVLLVAAVATVFADVQPTRYYSPPVRESPVPVIETIISEPLCVYGGIAIIWTIAVSILLILAIKRRLDFGRLISTIVLAGILTASWWLFGHLVLEQFGVTTRIISPGGRIISGGWIETAKVDHYKCHKCGGRTSEPGVGICRRCNGWVPEKCPKCGREMNDEDIEPTTTSSYKWYCKPCEYGVGMGLQ